MKSNERRVARRSPIKVLVKCLPAKTPARRNGHETHGWEMFARDIADDGVGLRWSREWAFRSCPHCVKGLWALAGAKEEDIRSKERCLCLSPQDTLRKGVEVQLDGLIYTEKGSQKMEGTIQWVRPARNGKVYDIGILITTPQHRNYFRTLEDIE